MTTARCYILEGAGDVSLQTEDLKDPSDCELLCETAYTAVSPGTELAAFNGLPPLRPTKKVYPRLLGYMNVARVMQAGSELRDQFPVGTLVYTHQAHRSHFLIEPKDVLAVVPRDLKLQLATVAYLYRLGWNGLRRSQAPEGSEVAIVGLGAIGLACLQLAKHLGLQAVGLTNHAQTAKTAATFGLETCSKEEASARYLEQQPSAGLKDAVLLTTNSWSDWRLSMAMTRFNGIVSVIGFPGRSEPQPAFNPLESKYFYDKQLTVSAAGFAPGDLGANNEETGQLGEDIATLLDWMKSGAIDPSLIVSSIEPADTLQQVYEAMNKNRKGAGTVVIDWSVSG